MSEKNKEKKTVGITCDNYKLSKFEEELKRLGFTYKITGSFIGNNSIIKVFTTADKVWKIEKMCEKIQQYFNVRNN